MSAPETPRPAGFRKILVDLFAIDLRGLAALRIALALLLLLDVWHRFQDLTLFYTDGGVFPVAWAESFYGKRPGWWSLHLWDGSPFFVGILLLLAGAAAVALLLGWRTRAATIVSWILLCSIQNRAPAVMYGGDVLLRNTLLWCMFLPLGSLWSLDARRAGTGQRGSYLSVASAGVLLQLALMYIFTGIFKYNDNWLSGDALYYALSMDIIIKPAGAWLLQFPAVLHGSTLVVLWLELVGPLLAFVPWKTGWFRLALLPMFVGMHLVIWLTMQVGNFSQVSCAVWLAFVPTFAWDGLERLVAKLRRQPTPADQEPVLQTTKSAFLQTICGMLLVYVVLWNVATLPWTQFDRFVPAWAQWIGGATMTRQEWKMFADVAKDDGWFVAQAELRDGTQVDLLRPDHPLDLQAKPSHISARFDNIHQIKFYRHLARVGLRQLDLTQRLCAWLAIEWNRRHPPQQQVARLTLWHTYEITQPPGEPPQTELRELGTLEAAGP